MKRISKNTVQACLFSLILITVSVARGGECQGANCTAAPKVPLFARPLAAAPLVPPPSVAVKTYVVYRYGIFGRRIVPRIIYVPRPETPATNSSLGR